MRGDQRTATENVRCWGITIYEKTQKTSLGGGGGGRFKTGRLGSATVQIKFLTQWTQQITSKSKQNKTKVTKEPVLTRTSKIVFNF